MYFFLFLIKEVKFLLESWSTGVRGMTTIHTDDVRNVPDRILNMLESRVDADRTENDVFQALDVAVLVRKRKGPDQVYHRYIDQMCFFIRDKGENKTVMMVFDGNMVQTTLPEIISHQFRRAEVEDPYFCRELEERLKKEERG
jgi:pilus assembly protein CpaF